jgi:CheY-like chemotaxis protein
MSKYTNILLVDDDLDDLSVFVEALRDIDPAIECTIAMNGRDGIQKLGAFLPDLIISDVNMPVMDGKDFLKFVRKNIVTAIPVVMVSTSAVEENSVLALGANYFFSKSHTMSELHTQLHLVLNMKF